MPTLFTDDEISALLSESKPLPNDPRSKPIRWREKRGHSESSFTVLGVDGHEFRVLLRQSRENPLDFSVILTVARKDSAVEFRLRRYNGKGHEHGNKIEHITFYDFHIHTATAKYQGLDRKEDSYAEPTDRYSDIGGALDCLLADCGFRIPDPLQTEMFQ
jgi:hypothetical protein